MFEVIEVKGKSTVKAQMSCNHVYVIDVSYSMYRSLPDIRQHLKDQIPVVASQGDTISVVYFSGRGECGLVVENVPVDSIHSVTEVKMMIDKWLRPIGMTAFVDPLVLVKDLAERLPSDNVNNLVLMTDGYDNSYSRAQIVNEAADLGSHYSSISFIEYGWYSDRELISELAQTCGGLHLFADGVIDYTATVDGAISGAVRTELVEVYVNRRAKHAIYTYNGQINIVKTEDGVVKVPEDLDKVYSIVPSDVLSKSLSEDHLYLVLYYAMKTSNASLAFECLGVLGDVAIIEAYTNAFTREEITAVESMIKNAVLDPSTRYASGINTDYIPRRGAKTVMDVLYKLAEFNARLDVNYPGFKYNRIGAKTEYKAEEDGPKFVKNPTQNLPSMSDMVFNKERPNVSIRAKVEGVVRLPENDFGLASVPSNTYRTYTIIRDGIKNVDVLPLMVDQRVIDYLNENHIKFVDVAEYNDGSHTIELDLSPIPIVSREQVASVTADYFSDLVAAELVGLYRLNYLNGRVKEMGDSAQGYAGLADKYGDDAAAWLATQGVRDYGFSEPSTTRKVEESTDSYMSVQLTRKIAKFSSIPKYLKVIEKLDADKKLTDSEKLMAAIIEEFKGATDADIMTAQKQAKDRQRTIQSDLSKAVYALVIGRQWFEGFEGEAFTTELDLTGLVVNDADLPSPKLTADKIRKEIKL